MNFIEWTKTQQSNNQISSNPRTVKTRQDRDRLTRMEAMLDELLLLKHVLVEAKAFDVLETSHANQN